MTSTVADVELTKLILGLNKVRRGTIDGPALRDSGAVVAGHGEPWKTRFPVTNRKFASVVLMVAAPWTILAPTLAMLTIPLPPFGSDEGVTYLRYKAFVGGNPSEVYSHFLDLVLMTGDLLMISLFLLLEAVLRKSLGKGKAAYVRWFVLLGLIVSGIVGTKLDASYGEGPVVVFYWVGFFPLLLATYFLLIALADRVAWETRRVLLIAAATLLVGALFQVVYEPSDTGGPNWFFVPLWLGGVPILLRVAWLLKKRQI